MPHKSGITTWKIFSFLELHVVGRLAPQILGFHNVLPGCGMPFAMAAAAFKNGVSDGIKRCGPDMSPSASVSVSNKNSLEVCSSRLFLFRMRHSACPDYAVLPVAEYGFFPQVQPLPDIEHLREGRRKAGQFPCADNAAKRCFLFLPVGKAVALVP